MPSLATYEVVHGSIMQEKMNEYMKQRKDKLRALKEIGLEVYGQGFNKDRTIDKMAADFKDGKKVETAGRITGLREHGKSAFLDLKDASGRIQVYIKSNIIGEEKFNNIYKRLDIGDILGIEGELFKTRTGEITINAKDIAILAKGLRPLPEKWHGLKDVEVRYRQRYVDLIVNEEVRRVFQLRSNIISRIREFLDRDRKSVV